MAGFRLLFRNLEYVLLWILIAGNCNVMPLIFHKTVSMAFPVDSGTQHFWDLMKDVTL
jgi:hypothetical protein